MDKQLQIWLKQGESERIEFKNSFGQDTIETLVAFANAKGGVVLIGVSDSKEIKGVDISAESINKRILILVLNMIVHRDYTSSYDSVIKIFKDRIVFYNPGTLPDTISLEQLLSDDYISQPHNKQIAEFFKEVGLIEKYGSGIKRVRQEFTEYGLPEPVFKKLKDGMIVTAFGTNYIKNNVTDITDNVTDVPDNVTDRYYDILNIIVENNQISTRKIAEIMNISKRTVLRDIEKMKEENMIERIGSEKGGYWKINNKQ